MPYKNPKQPIAIFLDLQRRKGDAAAKAFAHKHPREMSKGAKRRRYTPRKGRSS